MSKLLLSEVLIFAFKHLNCVEVVFKDGAAQFVFDGPVDLEKLSGLYDDLVGLFGSKMDASLAASSIDGEDTLLTINFPKFRSCDGTR